MILCKWKDDWFICMGRNAYTGAYGLRCGPKMPHPDTFAQYGNAWWYGAVDGGQAVRLFPTVRYRGIRVRPEGWKEDSREPILRVSASVVAADYPPLTDAETEALIAQLKSEGWQWDVREGGVGYVHVDDLEKIEGPPPHGAF